MRGSCGPGHPYQRVAAALELLGDVEHLRWLRHQTQDRTVRSRIWIPHQKKRGAAAVPGAPRRIAREQLA